MSKKLLPHEKALVRVLKHRLPARSYCSFSFHRYVTFSHALMAISFKPDVSQTFSLSIFIPLDGAPAKDWERFEWEGQKLKDCLIKLDAWLAARRRLQIHAPALPPPKKKRLPSGQLSLPAGGGGE